MPGRSSCASIDSNRNEAQGFGTFNSRSLPADSFALRANDLEKETQHFMFTVVAGPNYVCAVGNIRNLTDSR